MTGAHGDSSELDRWVNDWVTAPTRMRFLVDPEEPLSEKAWETLVVDDVIFSSIPVL